MNRRYPQHDLVLQLAHELRSPLSALRGAMEVLRRFGDDPAVKKWVVSALDRQTSQMMQLIEDVVTVSCEGRSRIVLHIQQVNLDAVVNGAVEAAQTAIAPRLHKLDMSLPPGPTALRADPARLTQVITNLLTNAAKFTEPGGRIELTAVREQHSLELRVRDNGVGIANDDLPHVFERFWQSSRNHDSTSGGMGIGLALVREIVLAHGGTVGASSAGPGRGSEFIVRLPQDTWTISANGSVTLPK